MGFKLENLLSYPDHSLIGVIAEGVPTLITSIQAITNQVALLIIADISISIMLCLLRANLYPIGFVIGLSIGKASDIVKRINSVYNTQYPLLEKVVIFGVGGFFALLAMPMTLNIAAFYSSVQWGVRLHQRSVELNSITKSKTPSLQQDNTHIQEVDYSTVEQQKNNNSENITSTN